MTRACATREPTRRRQRAGDRARGERCQCSACSSVRMRSDGGARSRTAAQHRRRRGARTPRSPVSCASRSRPSAALEPPEGIGVSSSSLRRAISCSLSDGGREEAAVLGVREAGDHLVGQRDRLLEPALLAGRFEQRDQRLEQEGVVLQVRVDLGAAVVVGAQQPAVARRAGRAAGTPRSRRAASR